MVAVSVSIQSGASLTWPRWQRLVDEVEALGFAGLYRSDHLPGRAPDLEMIVSLTYLASRTRRIEFGPLVAPVTFRDPALLAWQAAGLNDLSGGRMVLGIGAGWQEREHAAFGHALGDPATRSARFEEGLRVVSGLFGGQEPVTVEGRFFRLSGARLSPPEAPGRPRLLIGGNRTQRTLPLAARYADVWNALHLLPDEFARRSARLDELLAEAGRRRQDVRRTIMLLVFCGRDAAEVDRRVGWLRRLLPHLTDQPPEAVVAAGGERFAGLVAQMGSAWCPIVGTPDVVVDRLRAYQAAGADEIALQWFDADDVEGLQAFARDVLPRLG
jgi:alkanesulfonate monooxygenase SsuD/methylene tetrahydromethanopterin reductase-like flavin-dependent oxidoreductase (luciferase family)